MINNKLINQIFRFAIVGGIATIIDFTFLYLFKELLSFNIIIANTLSFIISVVYNYIASVKWVFDSNKSKNSKVQFIQFVLFSVFGLMLNNIIIYLCIDKFNIYYLIAKMIATVFVMVFNFITRKRFLE